ncbi:MAG: hypothetical protein ABI596_14660 [Pyrinomonadaceae bacterium]
MKMLKSKLWRWLIIGAVMLLTIIAVVIGSLKPASNVALTDLNELEELRTTFNREKGTPRLMLLLSPT